MIKVTPKFAPDEHLFVDKMPNPPAPEIGLKRMNANDYRNFCTAFRESFRVLPMGRLLYDARITARAYLNAQDSVCDFREKEAEGLGLLKR